MVLPVSLNAEILLRNVDDIAAGILSARFEADRRFVITCHNRILNASIENNCVAPIWRFSGCS